MNTIKIKKISIKHHPSPIPVYCLSTKPHHEVVVVGKEDRYTVKQCVNFGALFGASASTLMTETIKPNWKENDLDKYIKANKLEDQLEENLENIENEKYRFIEFGTQEENLINAKMFTVANDVRTKFFIAYEGLSKWIEKTRIIAKKQGYIVSVYGAIRRLPYLTFNPPDGTVDKGKYHNLLNVCLNTGIQNMEAVVVNRSILEIWRETKRRKMSTTFFGQIHDAMEMYPRIENEEWREFTKIFFEKCTQMYPEYNGIPLDVEVNVSDYHKKNELWDMGRKIDYNKVGTFVL